MATSIQLSAPQFARDLAAMTLELQHRSPLPEVTGIALAERLIAGTLTVEDISSMWRFFHVNSRHRDAKLIEGRTGNSDPLVRSWDLRGGERAKAWVDRKHAELVREGLVEEDPYRALLRADPEAVYKRFAAGAWRWEYGLDTPAKAARFYEDYHRATGLPLDLKAAFGESARAVGNAVYRRVHGPDPFKEAMKALTADSKPIREAARLDQAEIVEAAGARVTLTIVETKDGTKARLTRDFPWPRFIAEVVLAVERPDLLRDYPWGSSQGERPGDMAEAVVPYADVDGVSELLVRAYYGRRIDRDRAIRVLEGLRASTHEAGQTATLCRVHLAEWVEGSFDRLLRSLPEDADVTPLFRRFVAERGEDTSRVAG